MSTGSLVNPTLRQDWANPFVDLLLGEDDGLLLSASCAKTRPF